MKISTFICITNPKRRNDPYLEAIASHLLFSDEVVIVDGESWDGCMGDIKKEFGDRVRYYTSPWPQGVGKWTWEQFAKQWNIGLNLCTGDWVCAGEADHIWHERDAELIRDRLEDHGDGRPVCFADKIVSACWFSFITKAKFPMFINKKEFPNLGYGLDRNCPTDLAHPILIDTYEGEFGIPEGKAVQYKDGDGLGVSFWNYDKTFKVREQIEEDRLAANWAWNSSCLVTLGLYSAWPGTAEGAVNEVIKTMVSRHEMANMRIKNPRYHPRVMFDKLEMMSNKYLGSSLWGNIDPHK